MNVNCLNVALLHEHPEYVNSSAELLNKQWKISLAARVHQLNPSYEDLPNSIILLEEVDGEKIVIGHSRITRVLEDKNGCWICSVVIAEEKRKKGYGKYLMQKSEEHAKKLKYSTVYLNTHDQQGFYERLGYIYCSPVSSTNIRGETVLAKIWNNLISQDLGLPRKTECRKGSDYISENIQTNGVPAPPPPPPPPLPSSKNQNMTNSNLGKYWMKKEI